MAQLQPPDCRLLAALLSLVVSVVATVPADAQSRVDLNTNERRKAFLKPDWENWSLGQVSSGFVSLDGVEVAVRTPNPSALKGISYKGLLDFENTSMAADGVATPAGPLDIVLRGLSRGRHRLVTYHNEVRNEEPKPFDVVVNGQRRLAGITPTRRATNDFEVASAYLEFDATGDEEVVIRLIPGSGDPEAGVVLNGFELDAVDPRRKAIKPRPADGDGHVPENALLSWTPATTAATHHLYLGTDRGTVATAAPSSDEFMGRLSRRSYSSGARADQEYFWRVDEEDARGNVTRGDVWRFRVRHLAFPSAQGYGRFARGGRGGRVIKVTNLNDRGPGSLRAAIVAEGPRTVVFDVSGLITLESKLIVRNPFLTVAGQTAPGKGICIRKYNVGLLGAKDVIVRYLRVRPGNISGRTLDGMGMASSDHSIIDHCSISWTLDEAFSSRGAKNITLQRTLISEALNEAGHEKYPPGTQHGYAASIGGDIGSFHRNLLAHCAGRNWSLAGGLNNRGMYAGRLDIRNNVIYNWKHRATDGGAHEVNFVANYYKPGPSTERFCALKAQYGGFPGSQRYYMAGNVMPGHFDAPDQEAGRQATTERGGRLPTEYSPWVKAPFFEPHATTQSAREAYEDVLANVGCNVPALDEHDRRVIAETRTGTFKYRGSRTGLPGLPDSQEDVGGWEEYPEVRRPEDWDADDDGMADDWERRAGLNPAIAVDGGADRDGDGYTNLEEYLGWLVGEFPDPDHDAGER